MNSPLGLEVQVLDELAKVAWAPPPPVLGCIRQNVLAPKQAWRYLRGNAVLALIGTKLEITTPFGWLTVWIRYHEDGPVLLQFRGGKFSTWWIDDCAVVVGLINNHTTLGVIGTLLVQELDNALTTHYFTAPTNAGALAQEALAQWRKEQRLQRQSTKALYMCPRCPVLKRCMAMDLERGETADWPKDFTVSDAAKR